MVTVQYDFDLVFQTYIVYYQEKTTGSDILPVGTVWRGHDKMLHSHLRQSLGLPGPEGSKRSVSRQLVSESFTVLMWTRSWLVTLDEP